LHSNYREESTMEIAGVSRRKLLQGIGGLTALGMMGSAKPYSWLQAAQLPVPGAADWSRFGYDIHNTRFNPMEKTIGRNNVERLKEKWRFDPDENWVIQQTPAVVGNTIFFGSGRNQFALDSATGKA